MTRTDAPVIGPEPSALVTVPAIAPGRKRPTSIVVVTEGATLTPLRCSPAKPAAVTRKSYEPDTTSAIRYDPSAALVTVSTIVPFADATIVAPAMAAPPVARETTPPIEPGTITVKGAPLLARPATLTTTSPLLAPAGTTATTRLALQEEMAAATPLNLTTPSADVAPKFEPSIATVPPTRLEAGTIDVITGGTANATPLLASPPTVTTTSPDVAPSGTPATILDRLQLVTAAATPLNATVLVPCASPNAAPSIVTAVPT